MGKVGLYVFAGEGVRLRRVWLRSASGFDAEDTVPSAQTRPAPNACSFGGDTEQGGETPTAWSRAQWVLKWGSEEEENRFPWARSPAGRGGARGAGVLLGEA